MKLEGHTLLNATREEAWKHFTDANFVAECAPGLETLDIIEPDKRFRIVVGIGFGSIKAKFNTHVEFTSLEPMNRAALKASGKAASSNADVTAELLFSDGSERGTTHLHWVADAVITGTIASVAMRLLSAVTQKLSGQFFECAKGRLEQKT